MKTWPDGTLKSTGNAFDWNTGEPTVFMADYYFRAKGSDGLSGGQIASRSREVAEANGKEVATIGGLGRIVIDTANTRSFHVHKGAA